MDTLLAAAAAAEDDIVDDHSEAPPWKPSASKSPERVFNSWAEASATTKREIFGELSTPENIAKHADNSKEFMHKLGFVAERFGVKIWTMESAGRPPSFDNANVRFKEWKDFNKKRLVLVPVAAAEAAEEADEAPAAEAPAAAAAAAPAAEAPAAAAAAAPAAEAAPERKRKPQIKRTRSEIEQVIGKVFNKLESKLMKLF